MYGLNYPTKTYMSNRKYLYKSAFSIGLGYAQGIATNRNSVDLDIL